MPLNHKHVTANWQTLFLIYGGILGVWSLYRYFLHTSIWLEETLIKGVVFSLPIFIWRLPNKIAMQTVGITINNFFGSVYLGIIIGMVLGLAGELGNLIRHSGFQLSTYGLDSGKIGAFLILSLITAFWEQLLFSGYFLEQFKTATKNETIAVVVTSLLFSLIHLPIYYFVQHQTGSQILFSFVLMLTLGMGCSIIKLRQRNLIAPIMAQALWGVTIYLFR